MRDPGLFKEREFFVERRQKLELELRGNDGKRMRIKGEHHGFSADTLCFRDHFVEQCLVTEMHSIKIPNGHNWAKTR